MITPPYLIPGDTVGIVAPARKVSRDEISLFLRLLESWGLKYKFGRNLFGEQDQYSGSDLERAADFSDMLADPQVKVIIAARGGYGSLRTLRLIDFSKFEKNPKWIAGFSDITVFHSYINSFLNTESLHCLMPLTYKPGISEIENSAESLRKALFGEKLEYIYPSIEGNREGYANAELTGGNLSVLYSLNGTGFFPELNGKILFIEDIDEYLYHIDRMMLNLLHSNSLNKIKGLIIGGFTDIKDNAVPFGKTHIEIISEIIEKFNIPVSFSFPAGHQNDNRTLIFGRQMQLTVERIQTKVSFLEK
jgi:muramoyltetrapeptide carboxypeptidase